MIIEIKDIPNEQLIDKIDIHIDFQKNTLKIETNPKSDSDRRENLPKWAGGSWVGRI